MPTSPTLNDILGRALVEHWALPHFNISDLTMLRGLCNGARDCKSPLLIGTSEGEADFIGRRQAVALIAAFREEYGFPIYLNADHHRSLATAKAAIDAGYDSVHIDLSKLSLDENIATTREVVAYARAKNSTISVEGEVGYLVTESSKVYKDVVEVPVESLARVDDCARFVRETKVDRLAPAVGTLHGIAANVPKIDIDRIAAIRAALPVEAMVLHGGSGSTDADIVASVAAGITNVHVSTELRVAYTNAVRAYLTANPDESTPYKILHAGQAAIAIAAAEKIRLFGAENRTPST